MKPIYFHLAAGIAATFAVGASSACAQQQEPTGNEAVAPAYGARDNANWLDAPQTPGVWEYVDEPQESLALFGDATPDHLFVLRCDKASRVIGIARRGQSAQPLMMRVRAETADRMLTANGVPGFGLVGANLPARDPLFDAIAITKGRFGIEVEGMEPLYIPAWAEVTRVIEDCR